MPPADIQIRNATPSDLNAALAVERAAFGAEEEARLVRDLLDDPSARPYLSLLAFLGDRAAGHILFTRAAIGGAPELAASILAPLAVVPDAQKRGIGGELIRHGLQLLAKTGVDLVFVLGYPTYYGRRGFQPAGRLGFAAPYPIPDKDSDAWMVKELRPGVIGKYSGRVACAEKMDRPEYWCE
jgi:putative acetyltransferase